jgi:hypothetical protein
MLSREFSFFSVRETRDRVRRTNDNDSVEVPETLFTALRQQLSEAQLIELTASTMTTPLRPLSKKIGKPCDDRTGYPYLDLVGRW